MKSLAKSEEAGQARMLEQIADKMERLDQRLEREPMRRDQRR